ncbi:MerR family transcriptional regulator [Corynebacterium sp. CCM 9185]|uniref:MerR family transcriptional regulator n=1 Tax=Corynebacterium marambiense TaxID=2765364 RepID=A0ABS0VSS5_9CORY|nr:MerR family transcriptional regulator [Corynebacterium marambiense]MBI8999835.1 MerR family transcriptional regulator [Corynebacterium marambiense]MCK7662674.1 MerR family transcriptional regulator [Corynebacterium marambiense]
MRVKELAEYTDTTVRTIRYYHQIGLLPVPDGAGIRDYGLEHLIRVERIRHLRRSGLSLASIQNLIADDGIDVARELQATEDAINQQIATLENQRNRLRDLRSGLSGRCLGEPSESQFDLIPPLPSQLDDLYARLTAGVDDERSMALIRREKQLIQLFLHRGLIPGDVFKSVSELDESALKGFRDDINCFARIHQLDPEAVTETAEATADHFIDVLRTIGDRRTIEAISRHLRSLEREPARQLVLLAFPDPVEARYVDARIRRLCTRIAEIAPSRPEPDDTPHTPEPLDKQGSFT